MRQYKNIRGTWGWYKKPMRFNFQYLVRYYLKFNERYKGVCILKMWRIEVVPLTKRSARGCKRLYQKLTYNLLLDLPL